MQIGKIIINRKEEVSNSLNHGKMKSDSRKIRVTAFVFVFFVLLAYLSMRDSGSYCSFLRLIVYFISSAFRCERNNSLNRLFAPSAGKFKGTIGADRK